MLNLINLIKLTRKSKQNFSLNRNSLILFSIIVLEGFVSVAVEILTLRQLMPFVGSSVVVTSLTIGIFLLFLALGYWRGGIYKENFYAVLQRNFIWAAVFIGVGLSYLFVAFFFSIFNSFLPYMLLVLAAYLLFIIAPMVYFLGQTIPLTMNLVKQEKFTGATGGKVLFISTVGSFFGAILTTLILMEFFGVAWTVYINFILLAGLLLMLIFIHKERDKVFATLMLLIVTGAVYFINIGFEKKYFIVTNSYANYQVQDNISSAFFSDENAANPSLGKMLQINNSYASFIDETNRGFPYIELIKKVLFKELQLHNKNILILGAGGFTLSAENTFGNHFTYVDIDSQIKNVVANNFLAKIKGDFVAEDARTYLNHNHKIYDVIVSDAYSNVNAIPAELLTLEHFQNIRRALTKDGIAVFNMIANPFLNDPYSKRINNTIFAVFKNCTLMPQNYAGNLTNVLYVCRKTANENDQAIYTDNKNSVTLDFFRQKRVGI